MPTLTDPDIVSIAPTFRLQWEEAQDCYVILYPEGMVKLSQSAGEILTRCDGKKSIAQIITALNDLVQETDVTQDVYKFLEVAYGYGWIKIS